MSGFKVWAWNSDRFLSTSINLLTLRWNLINCKINKIISKLRTCSCILRQQFNMDKFTVILFHVVNLFSGELQVVPATSSGLSRTLLRLKFACTIHVSSKTSWRWINISSLFWVSILILVLRQLALPPNDSVRGFHPSNLFLRAWVCLVTEVRLHCSLFTNSGVILCFGRHEKYHLTFIY